MISKNLLPMYRQQLKPIQPIQPLRPLPPAPNFIRQPAGQRTMPIPGAPLLPRNPFKNIMQLMQAYRK